MPATLGALVADLSVGKAVDSRLTVTSCPVCGDPLETTDGGNCTVCASRPRTRSIEPVLEHVVRPLLDPSLAAARPLLAFAMTAAEEKLLEPLFGTFVSASLYGNYRRGHEVGVDVRDLSRYEEGMASGWFGVLLFDYLAEMEQALREVVRVTADGGVFMTHISSYRLTDGYEPPRQTSTIKPRTGYFEYVPAEQGLPNAEVGRLWFVDAMRRVGFDAEHVVVTDQPSGERLDWFVGIKRPRERSGAAPPESRVTSRTAAPPLHQRLCSIPVDPAFGFKRVVIELSVPRLPPEASSVDFAEHVAVDGRATDQVIACQKGGVAVSEDLGASWGWIPTPETGDVRLWNSFTTAEGLHLLQGHGEPWLYVYDAAWGFVERTMPAAAPWHGSRSIDEAGGAIVFGEYPENHVKYRAGFGEQPGEIEQAERAGLLQPSRLLRSTDGGRSWDVVLDVPWTEVRHFHTVIADPYQPGRWWASTGDRSAESRVWESVDHGASWTEVTDPEPDVALHPTFRRFAQSVFRFTDAVVGEDHVIWGSDDWLGPPRLLEDPATLIGERVGSRLFRSPKSATWRPETIGYVGHPVRSIVDVGEAYLVLTQAKGEAGGFNPQVVLLSRSEPHRTTQLMTIDNFTAAGTGLSYSRASRVAKDGVFFTFRLARDAFPDGPRILRWRVEFE